MDKWIADRLRGREWLEADLARALEVRPGTVNRWLHGTVPKPEMVERIAAVFGVDARDLLVVAGHIPADLVDEGDPIEREIAVLVRALPDMERQMVLEFIRFRREQQRRRGV